jgi:hypothetical protein
MPALRTRTEPKEGRNDGGSAGCASPHTLALPSATEVAAESFAVRFT